jgi:hypothetical protein
MSEKPTNKPDSETPATASTTSPPDGKTHEATTPPGQGTRDEDAIRISEDKLDQAGGGH